MDFIVELNNKKAHHYREIERIGQKIFQIENQKRIAFLQAHLGHWFIIGEGHAKLLDIRNRAVVALSIGEYGGLPFMEVEHIDIQNFNVELSLGNKTPQEVIKIKNDIDGYLTDGKKHTECNNNDIDHSFIKTN